MSTKKTKYVAVYNHDGQLYRAERTTTHTYNFAAVVQWSDGRISVGVRWSTTQKGAGSCLTKDQRNNGARVIAVVAAEPQPDLTAASKMFGKLLDGGR